MRWDNIYVNACATVLGRKYETGQAVAERRYDQADYQADGYLAVRVAEGVERAVDLGVAAANKVLGQSTVDPERIAIVIHSSYGPQCTGEIAPASYVQARSVKGRAPAMEINQFSNGGLVALDVACGYLTAMPGNSAALLTTSDLYERPGYDRFRADKGILFGDGGTGLVLSRESGVAKVLATKIIGDATYGEIYAEQSWLEVSGNTSDPAEFEQRRTEFLMERGELLLEMVESITVRQREAIRLALDEAGLTSSDITRWVFANLGQTQVDWELRKQFEIDEDRTSWGWGREVGHLGAGDQVGALAHLLETGALAAGDRIAMCGVGTGFTFGCAVLEVSA